MAFDGSWGQTLKPRLASAVEPVDASSGSHCSISVKEGDEYADGST
jgi:hypothetical protein